MSRFASRVLFSLAGSLSLTTLLIACGDSADGKADNNAAGSDAGGAGATGGTAGTGGTSAAAGASGSGGTEWPSGGSGGTGWPDGGTGGTGTSGSAGSAGTGGAGGSGGAAGTGGSGGTSPVDCSGIESHPDLELCGSGADHCEGIFTNHNGCDAFCAAAGLVCTASYGGEPGCQGPEFQNPLGCGDDTGHESDWCRCEAPGGGTGGTGGSTGCPTDPGNPPTARTQSFTQATYTNRPAWVLECRDYAYTAMYPEHESCDSLYQAGSASGTATFTFPNVPQGTYDVYFQGRHTASRNPAGALVIVSSNGQSWPKHIMQRDDSNDYVKDLHGTYCLSGTVTVLLDSTTAASDSVQNVYLEP